MLHDKFWCSRDGDGVVHHVTTVSHPVLLAHNDVGYEDLSTTFCDQYAGDWFEVAPDVPTTCFACFAAWLKLECVDVDYFQACERSLHAG